MLTLDDLPLLLSGSGPIPDSGPPIEVFELPGMTPIEPAPSTVRGVSFLREISATGSGDFTISRDDLAATVIQPGLHVVAFRREGQTVHTCEIDQSVDHTLDDNGVARQVITYQGRGSAAGLDRWVMWPSLGMDAAPKELTAVHDWRRPQYDVGDWTASNEICTVNDASDLEAGIGDGLWPTQPMAEDFTFDTGAQMLWTVGSDHVSGDLGWTLFVLDIPITVAGNYAIEAIMDNSGFLWIDTVQVLEVRENDGFQRTSFKVFELSAHTHRFAFAVNNRTGFGDNPGALAFNLWKVDQQNSPQRDEDDVVLPPIAVSTAAVSYYYAGPTGPWPAWNVGQILLHHHLWAQTRGLATWITPDFDTSLDAAGVAWPALDPGFETKTGTNGLKLLEELTAEGHIGAWRLEPDGVTWSVWGPGHVSTPGVSLSPSPSDDNRTGQIAALDRRRT